jgi:hypothetical protein
MRWSVDISIKVEIPINHALGCASLAGYTGRHERGHYTEDMRNVQTPRNWAFHAVRHGSVLYVPCLMPYGIRSKLADFGRMQPASVETRHYTRGWHDLLPCALTGVRVFRWPSLLLNCLSGGRV